jgi:hypothetical protein
MSDTELKETAEAPSEEIGVEHLRKMLDDARAAGAERDRQLAAEREARSRVERERDELAGHAGNAAEQQYLAQVREVEAAARAASTAIDQAEDAYAQALEAGDHRAAAKAQRTMTEATTQLAETRARKGWLEQNKERIVAPPVVQRADSDPYRAIVADLRPDERSWLEGRPKFLTDTNYRNQVFGASAIANGRGYARGSEPYFREMERILGEGEVDPGERGREREPEPRGRQMSADVAPARRSAPGREPAGRREVNLTGDQKDAADALYGRVGSADYIADAAERYKHYDDNLRKVMAREGRW